MQHGKTMSAVAFQELQDGEALRLKAYLDGGGVPTIGWGHTEGVALGHVITRPMAVQLLAADLAATYAAIDRLVTVPLKQGQFDCLADFTFNLGEGQLKGSTLLRRLNARDYVGASQELVRWLYDNGQLVNGLAKRRGREFARWYS